MLHYSYFITAYLILLEQNLNKSEKLDYQIIKTWFKFQTINGSAVIWTSTVTGLTWIKTVWWLLSNKHLHEINGRAPPPEKPMNYKLSLQLYKTFNDKTPTKDWIELNNNIINTSRQTTFATRKTNSLKVGMNIALVLEWKNQTWLAEFIIWNIQNLDDQ